MDEQLGAGWVLAKVNPPQDHIRTAEPTVGLPSTRETLPDWSNSCTVQNDGWNLEDIIDKERLREIWESLRSCLEFKTDVLDLGQLVGSHSMPASIFVKMKS